MKNDEFGSRMKEYEKAYAPKCIPLLPICVRLDGKNFSKWTKGLSRPYDVDMNNLMIKTTEFLVQETQAVVGYTQSDEISLIYHSFDKDSQVFFDGKIQKMCSILAAMATAKFNAMKDQKVKFNGKPHALFDCRVWQVPTLQEAVNTLVWREMDATKNSITMAASSVYSHNQLHGKNGKEKMDMLMEKGINWNDYPAFFKRGTYVRRVQEEGCVTKEELLTLPPKHAAHSNPDLIFKRSVVKVVDFPKIMSIANLVDVIFNNSEVILK